MMIDVRRRRGETARGSPVCMRGCRFQADSGSGRERWAGASPDYVTLRVNPGWFRGFLLSVFLCLKGLSKTELGLSGRRVTSSRGRARVRDDSAAGQCASADRPGGRW